MTAAQHVPYEIKSDPIAERYARGWHVLDAYCPHMGGDLSLGEVNGDSIVCPFHEWTDWKMTRISIESNCRELVLATNCRELVDNMADLAHFGPIHYTRNIYEFRNVQKGHVFQQYMSGAHDLLTQGISP